MEIEKLIAAIKLCGSTPRADQCKQCAYWNGGDMGKCIPRMTEDAATALEQLAAYEDTGLTPEEIKILRAAWAVNLKVLESYRTKEADAHGEETL